MKDLIKNIKKNSVPLIGAYVIGGLSFKFWYDVIVGGVYEPSIITRLFLTPIDLWVNLFSNGWFFEPELIATYLTAIASFFVISEIIKKIK